jgi:hypothetical protein
MMGDPQNRRAGLEQVAASANGNQRVTRALTVLAVQLAASPNKQSPSVAQAFQQIDRALEQLAALARDGTNSHSRTTEPFSEVRISVPPITSGDVNATREYGILVQLARIGTELNAMHLAAQPQSAPTSALSSPTPATN